MRGSAAGGGWSPLPHQLLDTASQSGGKGRLVVYLLIHRHGNGSRDGCWASAATLAREAAMKRDDVFAALRWLVEHGWLARESRPGLPSLYRCCRSPVPQKGDTPQQGDTPGKGDGTHPPKGGHPKRGAPPRRGTPPIPQKGTAPTPQKGTQTRSPEQEPSNKIPSSSRSLSPLSVSTGAADAAETGGNEARQREQPPAAGPGQTQSQAHADAEALAAMKAEAEAYDRWDKQAWHRAHPVPSLGPPPPPPLPPPARADHLPVPVGALPVELQCVADRIEGYWLAKGGSRSRQAFSAMLEELSAVAVRAGHQGVSQLLRQATQAGWPTLNGQAWLAQHREELAMVNRSAYQVFRAR